MMKSFFKKLAFVMALAMVVTLAAPAAKSAVAAEAKELAIGYQTGMAITEVNLAKVGATEDLRFLNAPANWKELDIKWTSTNENVVTVDSNGVVTAVAAGSAIVSVAVGTASASVTVNVVDLPTYTATMGTADNRNITEWTLEEAGDQIDLAFYGIKDYSRDDIGNGTPRYFCEWTSTDETVAEVDAKGLVTAVAPGKAKITLVIWNLKLGVKHDVDACWITVPAEETPVVEEPEEDIVRGINKTQNTVDLTFNKPVDLKLEDVTMFRIFNAADDETGLGTITDPDRRTGYEDFYVRDVWSNADKTVWTVKTFEDFTDAVWYEVNVVGFEKDEFQASVGPVAEVIVNATTAYLESEEGDLDAVPAELSVTLKDAKGVDVTTRYVDGVRNDDPANITYWLAEEDFEKFSLVNYNEIEFYAMATAKAMASYEASDVSAPVESKPTLVTPKARNAYGVEKVIDWTIVKAGNAPDWNATVKEVPAGEYNYILVTLLQDTRGDYYATYYKGATANGGPKYDGKNVYFTEDETMPFWLNGLYVEYKAMHMDTMLVETDGEIASYAEGKARFALYLYNQNLFSTNEFQGEILSQYVKVCHERQLEKFDTNVATLDIMKNTEEEFQNIYAGDPEVDTVVDAYYSEFSTGSIEVALYDIHDQGTKKDFADLEDAQTADFSITLTSETGNAALKTLVEETFAERLEDAFNANPQKFKLFIEANDFLNDEGKYITTKNQVRFRITDATTKTTKNITINLINLTVDKINLTVDEDNDGKLDIRTSTIDLIKEFVDEMKTDMYFEKFIVSDSKVNFEQRVYDAFKTPVNSGYSILLKQPDVKGRIVGYESDIWVANKAIVNHKIALENIVDTFGNNDASDDISVGDRVLVVTDKYNKVYPVVGMDYTNPAYNKKEVGFEAPATTTALGIAVEFAKTAYSASGTAVDFDKYSFSFRHADEATNEVVYAKEGTYTAEIRTIEYIDYAKGIVTFTKATGLSDKVTFNVTNNNLQVQYLSRDAVKYDDRSIYTYVGDEIITREIGSDEAVKELILETFNFKYSDGVAWDELKPSDDVYFNEHKLTVGDILYYTYTVTPSNNQLVINTVTFKVPILGYEGGWRPVRTGEWYRSTATVNKSITFGE